MARLSCARWERRPLTDKRLYLSHALNNVAVVSGTVSGNEIKLSMPASGYLTVTGNQMTGLVNGTNVVKLTLRKR